MMKNQTKPQKQNPSSSSHASSFRDPSGFVFWQNGVLLRKINPIYEENFKLFLDSGLYGELVKEGLLISHKHVAPDVIQPELIPFISYSYEWAFSQLKDAALLTLKIQKIALSHGMSLKDATNYNVQFLKGKPIFIDTLSFEKLEAGKPWVAYKQFCEQFLAPLALISYVDVKLLQLLIPYMNGIPLELANKLLPLKARINPGVLMHINLHAGSQKKHADNRAVSGEQRAVSMNALLGIVDSLYNTVSNLKWDYGKTAWSHYGADDYFESYDKKTLDKKKQIVSEFLESVKPKTTWDLGANTGNYSRIAAEKGISTISLDFDPAVVEQAYQWVREHDEENILPLYLDITNPTPAIGFENNEREALLQRPKPDVVMALALIHHLAIGANLPLSRLASFFADMSKNLIIEFVPKDDPQTQRLLVSREDVFPDYTQEEFEKEFGIYFLTVKKVPLTNSKRTLYLFKKKT